MSTSENLKKAFAGESQANQKYLAFAQKAEMEGLPMVAKIFRAAAQAESVHAKAHMKAMNAIRSTVENIQEAITGETQEFKEMYPGFISEAQAEEHQAALASFKNALAVEQVHASLYIEALKAVKERKDFKKTKVFVCPVCGNTVINEAPEKCPVCGAAKKLFEEVK